MSAKKKAIEIVLEDGETKVLVHAPTMSQFPEYLESFAVIQQIAQAFQSLQQMAGGALANISQVHISREVMDSFYPLLAMLSSISVDEYKNLSINDGMAIMFAYVQLLSPESLAPNPTVAGETQPSQPQAAE